MFLLQRLKDLCKEKGVSQTHLFTLVGRRATYSSDLKKGVQPKAEDVQVWADALGTTPAYLMGETDQKEKDPAGMKTSEVTSEELETIQLLRQASPEQQKAFLAMLRSSIK